MVNLLSSIPLDPEILSRTPPEVIDLILSLLEKIRVLEARVEELEAKLNKNSSNSNKPPSSDSPFTAKPQAPKKARKKRKRPGSRQQCLRPTEIVELHPELCSCGSCSFEQVEPYYIHQVVELPDTPMHVRHLILYRGHCVHCGKKIKAPIPLHLRSGFGPRLSAMIVELCGVHGDSRRATQDFLYSVLGVPVSQGAIQNVLDRASRAIEPHYEAIKAAVHACAVNHADETVWKQKNVLEWLWLLCNPKAAFFLLHPSRSKEAFSMLVGDWRGRLISDDYGAYVTWEHGRQTCLAHLIRRAKNLSERTPPSLSKPGAWLLNELTLLCRMSRHPPSINEWSTHCARMQRLINLYANQDDELGQLVRRIASELESLRLFLHHPGVAPTNNLAERTLRFAVLWRKRSFGTRVEKGDRFVERILSLRQTCRLQGKRVFPILVAAMEAFFQEVLPDTSWIYGGNTATP